MLLVQSRKDEHRGVRKAVLPIPPSIGLNLSLEFLFEHETNLGAHTISKTCNAKKKEMKCGA